MMCSLLVVIGCLGGERGTGNGERGTGNGERGTAKIGFEEISMFPIPRSPPQSAKPPGDVILGLLLVRFGEDLFSLVEFDQLAHVHEGREVGTAGRLLH